MSPPLHHRIELYLSQVIIFDPQYDAYIPLIIANGGIPRSVKLDPSDWSVPHEQLAAAFNDKTKLILINTPHNPTGKIFSREDLQFIAALCHKWGVYAVCDEVRRLLLPAQQILSLFTKTKTILIAQCSSGGLGRGRLQPFTL